MPAKTKEKEREFSIINSFKTIFSSKNLGKEAAEEHIKNSKKKTTKD